MATPWGITFDCSDARALAEFWKVALGYVDAPPPTGWDSWADWARHFDIPEDEWDDGASLVDPDGVLPPVGFLKVPEGKTAKNRLHFDLRVGGGRTGRPGAPPGTHPGHGRSAGRGRWHRAAGGHVRRSPGPRGDG